MIVVVWLKHSWLKLQWLQVACTIVHESVEVSTITKDLSQTEKT